MRIAERPHLSDSAAQQAAEKELVKAVAKKESKELEETEIELGRATIKVDGVDQEKIILCEAFARIGRLKPGQKQKVATDMLKLLATERMLGTVERKILCFADHDAAASPRGRSWIA